MIFLISQTPVELMKAYVNSHNLTSTTEIMVAHGKRVGHGIKLRRKRKIAG